MVKWQYKTQFVAGQRVGVARLGISSTDVLGTVVGFDGDGYPIVDWDDNDYAGESWSDDDLRVLDEGEK